MLLRRLGLIASLAAAPIFPMSAAADSVTQTVSQSTVSAGDTPLAAQTMDPLGVSNPIYRTVVQLAGEHQLAPGTVKAPANSTIEYSDDGTTYGSTGTSASRYVRFSGPAASSAGAVAPVGAAFNSIIAGDPNQGDGFAPIVTDTRVYNVNHHTEPLRVECHELNDGTVCDGYPFTFPTGVADLSTGFAVHATIDEATGHLWVPAQVYTDSAPVQGFGDAGTATGFACIDVGKITPVTPSSCGWVPTGTGAFETWPVSTLGHADWGGSLQSGASFGRKLYAIDTTGAIQCVDMSAGGGAGAACAGQPFATGLQTSDPFGIQLTQIGDTSKFVARTSPPTGQNTIVTFSGNGPSEVICFDASIDDVCTGWGGGPQDLGTASKTVNGAVISAQVGSTWDAFCGIVDVNEWYANAGSTLDVRCLALDGTGTVTAPAGLSTTPSGAGYQFGWANLGEQTTFGTRVYFTLNHFGEFLTIPFPEVQDRLVCYDYATGAVCTNFPRNFSGGTGSENFSSTYATAVDPTGTCVWTLGDPGQLVQHDADDPSTACSFATVQQSINRADAYCGSTPAAVASAAWDEVKIRNVASPADYSGAYLTVYDANGDTVSGWSHVAITGSAIDISSIPATGSTSQITVVVRFGGAEASPFASNNTFLEVTWDSTEMPRTCVGTTVAAASCPTIATGATFNATTTFATSGSAFGPERTDQDVLTRAAAESVPCQPVTTTTTTETTTTTTTTTTPTQTTPTTTPAKPVISLTKVASKTRLRAGQRVKYTIRVSVTRATAEDVVVCDQLPGNMVYSGVTSSQLRKGEKCWSLGDMKAGTSRTLTVNARAATVTRSTKVTNRATATGSNVTRKSASAAVVIVPPSSQVAANYLTG